MQNNNYNNQNNQNSQNNSQNYKNRSSKNQTNNKAKNDCGKGDAHPDSDKQNDKYLK